MVQIRPIEPDEWNTAKRIIYRVAHHVFQETRGLEEMIVHFDARGTLDDMDDIQTHYFDNSGIFLVTTAGSEIIGTGAIRYFEGGTCELKRVWLLPEYHHKGLGYRMMQELLSFARNTGYRRIRLETDPIHQQRAVEFYKGLGFKETPNPEADDEDIVMEMDL